MPSLSGSTGQDHQHAQHRHAEFFMNDARGLGSAISLR
jgi:hypothetical protein